MKKEFLAIIMLAMLFTLSFSSCSKDDEKQDNDLVSAFIGTWKSIDSESEILYLKLNSDRTGKWLALYNGKVTDTYRIKRWDYKETTFFITRENGENESASFNFHEDKLQLGEVLYQKSNTELPNPGENSNFSLSENEISIPVEDEANITINGVNIDDCELFSENDFVAEVINYSGKINITAKHTGETYIHVRYKNLKDSCKVVVSSLINYIGNPILDFGASKSEIKAKLKGEIQQESSDRIEIKDDFKYPIYSTYHFKDDKLECVYSSVNVITDWINITNSLLERYDYLSSESDVHWYSYPNKFIVRENKAGGNGGFQVRYAKDKETIGKYYQL